LPNAGKSSLLASLTRAKPKIANYPFTTINPNLGVTYYNNKEVTLADIPGLVEGAHKGIGLGDKFLRHIERCKILLHLIDCTENNLAENYLKVRSELKSYDPSISKKKEIIYINKSDLVEKKTLKKKIDLFRSKIKKKHKIISVFKKDDIQTIKKVLVTSINK
tara:strand:- start:73 stop:561 length:489 start_codon:yes stop_codon:yes gene_type:complete